MKLLREYFIGYIEERVVEITINILNNNSEYTILENRLGELFKFIDSTDEFIEYDNIISKQISIIRMEMYKQGFIDGISTGKKI